MASVASQLIEEVTAHAQSDSLEDARVICADGIRITYVTYQNQLHVSANAAVAIITLDTIYQRIHIDMI